MRGGACSFRYKRSMFLAMNLKFYSGVMETNRFLKVLLLCNFQSLATVFGDFAFNIFVVLAAGSVVDFKQQAHLCDTLQSLSEAKRTIGKIPSISPRFIAGYIIQQCIIVRSQC